MLLLEINLIIFRHLLFLDKIKMIAKLDTILDLTCTHSGAKLDIATVFATMQLDLTSS